MNNVKAKDDVVFLKLLLKLISVLFAPGHNSSSLALAEMIIILTEN